MTELEQILDLIVAKSQPLPPVRLPLTDALHHVLASEVLAREDHPPFHRSAMDGFLVNEGDPSTTLKIVGEIRAGTTASTLPHHGETLAIFTGAAIPPEGRWKVVLQEHVQRTDSTICIKTRSDETFIRQRGTDLRQGSILLPKNTFLGPIEISLLAGEGILYPEVYATPNIAHFTTGDEIIPPDQEPVAGQIRDGNGPLIRALLQEQGISLSLQKHWGDTPELGIDFLKNHSSPFQVILISGGSSVGRYDFTARILEETGFEIHCRQLNLRPGKPLIFASRNGQLAFGLPGNPISHWVCFHLIVRHALQRLKGDLCPIVWQTALLACDYDFGKNPRRTFWPCHVGTHVQPLSWNNSGHLHALRSANGLIRVSQTTPKLKQSDPVEFYAV